MARGLSETQKKIITIIKDLSEKYEVKKIPSDMVYKEVREKLYPELYPHPIISEYGREIKQKTSSIEKARGRVIISRSIKRLIERGILTKEKAHKIRYGYEVPNDFHEFIILNG